MAGIFDQLFAGSAATQPSQTTQPQVPTNGASGQFTRVFAAPSSNTAVAGQPVIPPAPGQPGYVPPSLSDIGGSLVQSGRDVLTSLSRIADYPGPSGPGTKALQQQSAAWQQVHEGDIGAQVTRAGGDIALTAPLVPTAGPEAIVAAGTERALTPLVGPTTAKIAGVVAGRTAGGAVAGGGTNALSGGGYVPPGQDYNPLTAFKTGAEGGAILGGALGVPGAAAAAKVTPELEAAAGRINYPLTRGDPQGPSGLWKNVEDVTQDIPGAGGGQMADRKTASIATTIGNEMGLGGPRQNIMPNDVLQAEQNTSAGFQALTPRLHATMTPALFGRLQDEVDSTYNAVPGSTQSASYNAAVNLRNRIYNDMMQSGTVGGVSYGRTGMMTGDRIQNLIRFRGPLWRMQNSADPEVRDVANSVNEALFDAIKDPASGNNPPDLTQFQQLRGQWKAQQQFQPLINNATNGLASVDNPSVTIRNIITRPKTGWDLTYRDPVTGNPSPMTDLAQVLGTTKPLKASGTGRQVTWQKLAGIGGEGLGVGAPVGAILAGNPELAAHAFTYGTVPAAGLVGLGRFSRFGPGMGIPGVAPVANALAPVIPRTFGPMLGNRLTGQQQGGR